MPREPPYDIRATVRGADGQEREVFIEVKATPPAGADALAGPVYFVGPDHRLVWVRGFDRKPSLLERIGAKSAAFGVFETESDELRTLARKDPGGLETRLQTIRDTDRGVGWYLSDLLARKGLIAVGEPKSK